MADSCEDNPPRLSIKSILASKYEAICIGAEIIVYFLNMLSIRRVTTKPPTIFIQATKMAIDAKMLMGLDNPLLT